MKSMAEITTIVTNLKGTIITAGPDPDFEPDGWGMMFTLGPLLVGLSSGGLGWDHVSVSRKDRVPRYEEMVKIKRICFKPNEWAMELHAPPSKHISCHPYCLHLWRPLNADIPTPPEIMV